MGVKAVDDKTLEVTLTTPTAVVRAAGRAPLVPGREPEGRRAVRRQVDRGGEHRHERPVQARAVGAQRQHRPRQVGRVARRRRRQADARQRPDDHRRPHRRAGLRGRRDRRPQRRPADGRDVAAEGDARVRAVHRARDVLLRLQHRRTSRTSTSARRCRSQSTGGRSSTTSSRPTSCRRPGFTPKGMPGFDAINPESPWTPPSRRHGAGEAADGARSPTRRRTSRSTSTTRRATARSPSPSRRSGRSSGSRARSSSRSSSSTWSSSGRRRTSDVDVYRLGWIGDFVDAINFLELWTCDSGNNSTNFCNEEYDAKIEEARDDRGQRRPLRALRRGGGDPLRRGRRRCRSSRSTSTRTTTWRSESVKESFNLNLLDQVDLTKVVVTE